MTPEVLTVGRVSVDLYPEQIGVPLADVRTFRKMLGGSPTNVAVAAARLGRRAAVVTKVGDDPFGAYVRRALAGFGVDVSRVGTHPSLRTPLAFCEIFRLIAFRCSFTAPPRRRTWSSRHMTSTSTKPPACRSSGRPAPRSPRSRAGRRRSPRWIGADVFR